MVKKMLCKNCKGNYESCDCKMVYVKKCPVCGNKNIEVHYSEPVGEGFEPKDLRIIKKHTFHWLGDGKGYVRFDCNDIHFTTLFNNGNIYQFSRGKWRKI